VRSDAKQAREASLRDAKKLVGAKTKDILTLTPPTKEEQNLATILLLTLPDSMTVAYEAGYKVCDCCKCVLGRQEDFLKQKSGIEEAFDAYNLKHGTRHRCLFLPKFHPELNYIERYWGRMKFYVRLHSDCTVPTLEKNMLEARSLDNIPLAMIRRFARGTFAYLYAYRNKLDIIKADAWVKKHRTHRGHRDQMDKELEKLYYPNGRENHEVLVPEEGENREDIRDDRDDIEIALEMPDEFMAGFMDDLDSIGSLLDSEDEDEEEKE
jgi:hypothetical protein